MIDLTSTAWQAEGDMVFRLHQEAWHRGDPIMVNAVTIHIDVRRGVDEDGAALARRIAALLNGERAAQ